MVRLLKTFGLYNALLRYKHRLDRDKAAREEKINEEKRVRFYSGFLNPGDLVFDVGANVGSRVRSFLAIGCKVVAVEPQKVCADQLRQHFGNRIAVVEKGLGSQEEERTMYISEESNTLSSFSEDWVNRMKSDRFSRYEWNNKTTISLTTMDKLIGQYGLPKFCKIDVEGFELEVLKGLSGAVPMISLEYAVPEATDHILRCIERTNQLNPGYKYNYSIGESMELALDQYYSYEQFTRHVVDKKFQDTGFGDVYISL